MKWALFALQVAQTYLTERAQRKAEKKAEVANKRLDEVLEAKKDEPAAE